MEKQSREERSVVCPACLGSGTVFDLGDPSDRCRRRQVTCDICGGSGRLSPEIAARYEAAQKIQKT